ncbi:glutamine--fructose-6-phosphate transaminase (isomerizing) [Mycoplasmatota bacterium]|nr:glutamine--fructose-6-phosphate transaminase (isomerizing) [Mycoplasmatota bacterium]
MCGIVGYIGKKDVKNILLTGLQTLEYRGYDSAGLALYTDEGIAVYKEKGRIEQLRQIVGSEVAFLGIGHTRWATHGVPNQVNSHPHQSLDGRFVLVHNGVIENDDELREKYFVGHPFRSETDTEVIVELLSYYVRKYQVVDVALRHLMNQLHGSYALAIIDNDDPDTFYVVKNKSPLLIGKGEGFNMVGSDAIAMLKETNLFYELDDLEYAKITRDKIEIYEITGALIEREPFETKLDANDIEKGTYSHFMLKEIDEQPFVLRRIIKEYEKDEKLFIDECIINEVRNADRLYIIAAGTSFHAGLIGKQLFETLAQIPVEVHISSEFVYNMPLISQNPLFIFISQSGETADSRASLVRIKAMGYKSLAITNVEGSTLYRETDYQLLLHAGPEIAVASTKAYSAQIAVLSILAYLVADEKKFDLKHELSLVANVIETLCDDKELFDNLAKELFTKRNCFYIGRTMDYYVALEAALKLKEISYIQTEGFASGELKHGTIALIEEDTPVIAIISQENTNLNTRSNIKEVKARGAKTLMISLKSMSAEKDQIVIDDVYPLLTPLVTIIPTQLLAYYAALHRYLDIDKPRNLAKSVTVE